MSEKAYPVALARAHSYAGPELSRTVGDLLDAARLPSHRGATVLVKPNLLMAHGLSCTTPQVVAAACRWLLDHGARITVADSPAFGTAVNVADAIGLNRALVPLGIRTQNFSKPTRITLKPSGSRMVDAFVAPEALNCDFILSVPRVKAHSQLRITLAVKNCFGCICGLRKALAHAGPGLTRDLFADRVAALWAALPPVWALADGIEAMNITGPRNGKPFQLGILGASASAPALDSAIIELLGLEAEKIPLSVALAARCQNGDQKANPQRIYPLARPCDLATDGFIVPEKLKNISFNPLVLFKSLTRRIWLATFAKKDA